MLGNAVMATTTSSMVAFEMRREQRPGLGEDRADADRRSGAWPGALRKPESVSIGSMPVTEHREHGMLADNGCSSVNARLPEASRPDPAQAAEWFRQKKREASASRFSVRSLEEAAARPAQVPVSTASVTCARPSKPSARAAAGVTSMTAAADERPAVIDAHDDRTAGLLVGDPHFGAERQGAVRRGQARRRRPFAVGGESAGINGSKAFLCGCGHRYSDSGNNKSRSKHKLTSGYYQP